MLRFIIQRRKIHREMQMRFKVHQESVPESNESDHCEPRREGIIRMWTQAEFGIYLCVFDI